MGPGKLLMSYVIIFLKVRKKIRKNRCTFQELHNTLTKVNLAVPCRHQFPVRPAFSMTAHKVQGQAFEYVGVDLRTPVFMHGMLYVVLSSNKQQFKCAFTTRKFSTFLISCGNKH